MPESWDPDSEQASPDVQARRAAAGIPDKEHHRPKWQLGLECVDEALSWKVPAPQVLAGDAGYGDAAGFRHGLTEHGIPYAVQISHTLTVLPATATWTTPDYRGCGPPAETPLRTEDRIGQGTHHRAGTAAGETDHLAYRIQAAARRTAGDERPVRVRPHPAGRRRHPPNLQRTRPARVLAHRRMATRHTRTHPLLAVHPARRHPPGRSGPRRETTLADRTRLPRVEDRSRPRPLRRPQMGRLAPPRHPRRSRPRLPHPATTGPKAPVPE